VKLSISAHFDEFVQVDTVSADGKQDIVSLPVQMKKEVISTLMAQSNPHRSLGCG
jgi:hypothetical protein